MSVPLAVDLCLHRRLSIHWRCGCENHRGKKMKPLPVNWMLFVVGSHKLSIPKSHRRATTKHAIPLPVYFVWLAVRWMRSVWIHVVCERAHARCSFAVVNSFVCACALSLCFYTSLSLSFAFNDLPFWLLAAIHCRNRRMRDLNKKTKLRLAPIQPNPTANTREVRL